MTNKRRNKGPEHIREILDSARKEWRESLSKRTIESEEFRSLEARCPAFIQIVFLHIEGDPRFIRTINLN